jgi:AcrR family transcriptional regulator
MTPRTRTGNRREQIIREATRLFSQGGYRGTSIRAIAAACGVSEAAIYRHFTGKVALYESVIRSKADEHDIAGFLNREGGRGTIEDVLTAVAEHILGFLDTDPELLGLMFNNSVETGPAAAVLFKEVRLPYITYVARELERRASSGEVLKVEPYITSRCFVGMVMDCAMSVGAWNRVGKFEFNAGDVICNNVPIFARGLETKRQPVPNPAEEEG